MGVAFMRTVYILPIVRRGNWHSGSTGRKRRILVYSNGSKFPITDAAGLFPYFRLQVFDFDSGAELYREEDITRTGDRSATISPDGD